MAKKKGNSWNRQGTQSFRKCYGKKSSAKQTVAPKFLIDSTILRCENCNNQFWSLPVGDFHPWPMIRRKTHRFGVPTSLHATWPDLTNQPTNQPSPYPALMPSPCHLQGSLWWFQKKWWTREKAKKPVENWAEKISQHQKIPWSLPPTTVAFFSWRISQGRNDINISWSGWWSGWFLLTFCPLGFFVHLMKPNEDASRNFSSALPAHLRPTRFHRIA